MDLAGGNPHASPTSAQDAAPGGGMARVALGLSIVAFILPLGIAAIVLGHMAERRIDSGAGLLNGKATARAALWIAYIQLALVTLTMVVAWSLFHETAKGFQRDALVQRFFRSSDRQQTLDPQSAQEAELTARTLAYQLIAIEDESRRYGKDGLYICELNVLLATGVEGTTDAERRALAARVSDSPYMFAISNCNPSDKGEPAASYILTAVPRPPRMPEGSAIFCADQTGVVRSTRGRTSLDCIANGEPVR
jgi:hypothetical protein